MSDVNLVFSVNTFSSTVTVDTTTVNVTPNTTAINMFAGYAAYPPNGATGNSQVLFNDAGLFGGNSNFTYNKTASRLTVSNITVANIANLGSASNVRITGGSAGQYLMSNGAGGVSFATLSPGGGNTQLQYNNNGTFAGMTNVTYTNGNISLGNIGNVKINGGTNGYVLQTDGTGNLTWTAQIGGTPGNGSPGGSNSQVQFNDAGLFGGDAGFTYDKSTNLLTVDSMQGNLVTANQANITNVGSLTSLTVVGTSKIQQGKEKVTINGSAPTSTEQFDVLDQAIMYSSTNMSTNVTLNVRGNSTTTFSSITSVGESVTLTYVMTVGSTVYYPTALTIDGTSVTPKWLGGIPPIDGSLENNTSYAYCYTIIKTGASTYVVLASYSGYQ